MKRLVSLCLVAVILAAASSCAALRGIKYGNASTDDHKIFDQDTVRRGTEIFSFAELPEERRVLDTLHLGFYRAKSDTVMKMTMYEALNAIGKPAGAIVIRNDTILYEGYAGGWDRPSQSCVFSVTKTITSLLCGIAIKDGYIKSTEDFVTEYIPELKDEDPMFSKLRICHLLDMTAGLKFTENYNWNPFSKMAQLYMGKNSFKAIRKMKFRNGPGEVYHYNSMTTAILGLVIERAVGMPYSEYLSEKVWKPLGMEQDALIGLDSRKHRVAKSYAGLTTNVRDLAKIGRLYLYHGNWNGVQIADSAFVSRSTSMNVAGKEQQETYSYSWRWGTEDYKKFPDRQSLERYYADFQDAQVCGTRRDRKSGRYEAILHRGGFWAYGLYGQVLYINTEKNYIGVYLGVDRIEEFYSVFDRLYDIL